MANGMEKNSPQVRRDRERYALDEMLPRFGFEQGAADLCAWGEKIKKMTLQGLEEKTTCPLLNISTSGEGKYMYNHAKAFFDKLSNPQMVMDPRADSSS
jgi:hypothetical protein